MPWQELKKRKNMPDRFFVDTNVFIRFYRHDNPRLSPLAEKIISDCVAGKTALVICPVTVLEIVWLLTSFYKLPRTEIIRFVEKILVMANLEILEADLTKIMSSMFREKNIDVTNAYFPTLMDQQKISKIFSFDHDLDKISNIKRLE